jgi:hypothetical protein
MLAWNICERSFRGLLRPLDFNQGAPIGFLWIEKAVISITGPTDLAFRLVPFLASLASLLLVAWFCRANLGRSAALVGVSLFALAPELIAYAGEAKQYSLDVFAGLLILALAAEALRSGLSTRRGAVLALVGGASIWFSHPSVFFLGGAGAVLLLHAVRQRDARQAVSGLALCGFWGTSFLVNYVFFLSSLNAQGHLNQFWKAWFLPLPPRSLADARQYLAIGLGLFESLYQNIQVAESIGPRMGLVTCGAWLAGVFVLLENHQRRLAALLLAPLACATLACLLHKYPLGGRVALFSAGPILLTATAAVVLLAGSASATQRTLGRLLFVGLAGLTFLQDMQFLLDRPRPYGARTVLEQLSQAWRPGDVVLFDDASAPPFVYYQKYGSDPNLRRIAPTHVDCELREPDQLIAEAGRLRGRRRVWLLFTAIQPDPRGREDGFIALTLDQLGTRLEEAKARGYYAYLYDFGETRLR